VFLTIGDLVTDVVVWTGEQLHRGSDTPARITHARGGSAANVAVAVAHSGFASTFVGQVGDDARGHTLVSELEAEGVTTRVRHLGTTGTIVVLVDADGERSFLSDRGASTDLSIVDDDLLDGVDWLHIPGYSFTAGALSETCHTLIGEAVERSIPISMSTSSESALIEFGRHEFLELIRAVQPTLVVANRDEARFLLRDHQQFPATTWTVVTSGHRPTVITHSNGEQRRITPPPVDATDSTGAGDAFTGGFITSMLLGETAIEAVEAGHRLAALTLQEPGARLLSSSTPQDPQ
jgi:sugar/nucleoside kinase (ribokinase family)